VILKLKIALLGLISASATISIGAAAESPCRTVPLASAGSHCSACDGRALPPAGKDDRPAH
jgi:hypothetical protein